MGYKDKYNKLVEAIKVLQETNPSDEGLQNWVNDNVPELKESEAERIRKWCISHFNGCISVIKENDEYKEFLSNKVVAWLEKQGETNPYSGVSFKYNGHTWGMCARDNGVEISCDKQFIKQLDEQGERPRYNIGDILCDLSCNEYDKDSKLKYEIIDIKNGMYICDNGSIPVSQQDEYKLVAKKAEQKPVKVNNDEDSVSNELREASFIFAARQMVHKASPEERKLELIYSFEEGAKWNDAQKSAWSEKYIADVFEKVGLAKIVREQSNDALAIALQDAMIELSKVTLQPMQEWTAEDEEELKIALDTLVKAGQHSSAKWLKNVCLVPQNKWKPSDEQMEVLLSEVTGWKKGCSKQIVLESLYNDLKKLK